MGAAIRGRTCTAELCQDVLRMTVVHDVRLFVGGRDEAARVANKVFFAERDAVGVDQRLLVALPDPVPADLVRHRQVDEDRRSAGLHHGRCPVGTFFVSPEAMVDHDVVARLQELLKLKGDVLEYGSLLTLNSPRGKSLP